MDRHQTSKTLYLKVTDLLYLWHVVVAKLEEAIFAILVAKVAHKLCDSFSEVHFEAIVLFHNSSDEVKATGCISSIKAELHQMTKIDEHSHLLILSQFFSLNDVVFQTSLILQKHFFSCTLCICMIVRVFLGQLKAIIGEY